MIAAAAFLTSGGGYAGEKTMELKLSSPAFVEGGEIPRLYT